MSVAKRGVLWLIDGKLRCFPFDENAQHGFAVAVDDVAQYEERILVGKTRFVKQSLELFDRIAVKIGNSVGAH